MTSKVNRRKKLTNSTDDITPGTKGLRGKKELHFLISDTTVFETKDN